MALTIPKMIAEMHRLRDELEHGVVGSATTELQGIFDTAEVELSKQDALFQSLLTDSDGKLQNIPENLEVAGAYYRDTVKPQIDDWIVGPGKQWAEKNVGVMHKAGRTLARANLDVTSVSPELIKAAFNNVSIAEKGILKVGYTSGYQIMNTVGDDVGVWFRQTMMDSVVEGIPVTHHDPKVDSLQRRLMESGRIKPISIKAANGSVYHRTIKQRAQAIARIESTRIINRTHETLAEETLGDEAVFRNSNPQDSRSTFICEHASQQKAMSLEAWDNSHYGRPPRLSPFHLCRSVLIAGLAEWFDDVPEAQLQGAGLAATTKFPTPKKTRKAAVQAALSQAASVKIKERAAAAARKAAAAARKKPPDLSPFQVLARAGGLDTRTVDRLFKDLPKEKGGARAQLGKLRGGFQDAPGLLLDARSRDEGWARVLDRAGIYDHNDISEAVRSGSLFKRISTAPERGLADVEFEGRRPDFDLSVEGFEDRILLARTTEDLELEMSRLDDAMQSELLTSAQFDNLFRQVSGQGRQMFAAAAISDQVDAALARISASRKMVGRDPAKSAESFSANKAEVDRLLGEYREVAPAESYAAKQQIADDVVSAEDARLKAAAAKRAADAAEAKREAAAAEALIEARRKEADPSRPRPLDPPGFAPVRSTEEFVDRIKPYLSKIEKSMTALPVDRLNSILRAAEGTLGPHGVHLSGLEWKGGGRGYGVASADAHGGPATVGFMRAFVRNPKKYADRDTLRFNKLRDDNLRSKKSYIDRMERGKRDGSIRGNVDDEIAKAKMDLQRIEATANWSTIGAADDPLFAMATHEFLHALDAKHGWNLGVELDRRVSDVRRKTGRHIFKPTDYAKSNAKELWTEAGTALSTGLKIDPAIEQAFLEILAEVTQ